MAAIRSLRTDRIADCGLLAAYTMLARRRSGRGEPVASGNASGPFAFRSEQFGFTASMPSGWTRQSGDALLVERYGVVSFQDTAVLTPSGCIVRIAMAFEPARPSEDAMDELVQMFEAEGRGETVIRTSADAASFDGIDLAMERSDGSLALARLGIAGRRVVFLEGLALGGDDDETVRQFFGDFDLLRGEPWDPRTSGTFPTPARG
jgi:hypothetical protein